MRRAKRLIAFILCLLMVCTLLAGCTSARQNASKPPTLSSDDSGFGCIDPSVLDTSTASLTPTPSHPSP